MPEYVVVSRSSRPRSAATFPRDAAGVSAIEFALTLPLMLTLFAGMSEMAHAIDNWRKVTLLARTVSDLTSQGDAVDPIASATMSDIMGASSAVIRPFAPTNVTIVVSALGVDASASATNPRVCSSIASSNTTARSTGVASDLTIPVGFNTNGNRYVLAEITQPYAPMLGSSFVKLVKGMSTITLKSSFAWPVRNGVIHNSATNVPEVTMPGGSPCP